MLRARAYDASNVPIEFPLRFVRESPETAGAFVATRRLFVQPSGDLVVDAYHRDYIGRPRLTSDATNRASAERLARVVLIQEREALPSDDLSLTEQAMRVAEQD